MSDNKTMIRFYAFLLFITALLTYVVDLNEQFHFFILNFSWISNAFCFTILSGVLTGVVVALAAEIRLYWIHKRQAQNMLFSNAAEMYALLSIQKSCIEYYINNIKIPIPENIGSECFQQPILARIGYLECMDYSPFFKRDIICENWLSFSTKINEIEKATRNLAELQIEWNKIKLLFLEKGFADAQVTATEFQMNKQLKEKFQELKQSITVISDFCDGFEKFNSKRFTWTQSKKISDDMSEKIKKDPYYRPDKV